MDEDGANPHFLTRGDYMVLTPRFNPDGADDRLYVVYRHQAEGLSVRPGNRQAGDAGQFPNMTFIPRFSPDGNKVALTPGK